MEAPTKKWRIIVGSREERGAKGEGKANRRRATTLCRKRQSPVASTKTPREDWCPRGFKLEAPTKKWRIIVGSREERGAKGEGRERRGS